MTDTPEIRVGDTVRIAGSWIPFEVKAITPSGTLIGGTAKAHITCHMSEAKLVKRGEDNDDNEQ